MVSTKAIRPTGRVTRSISFERELLEKLRKKARRQKRSVNWLVNEAVRRQGKSVAQNES